ncbi:lipopolysaccharide core heptose(I) kinase RfaP [Alcanivorax sp. 97CO-5]|uniref:lipopolysaccharide core heptose(I) kinase RfaP n=1 Tax=unclassified Alcanivorax TaxID=2638842 RepID=UPI0003E7E7F4|nr:MULTISPECIES: lipopolysaccharide core heptose(I) kinase RfaP [unclassified Alcanivorax]EUC67852.1 lipopolysaccharide core heptose(I) kinase RfaP [Alcanivorax sp. 97CO-5]PKG00288.1 lipopolysaccharide core heptose(I) kinase RfaP [Alcanivorax sp. 97CO-6]
MKLFLRDDIGALWSGDDPFARAAEQDGEVFRAREGRRTLRFYGNGRSYFLKYHGGIGWKEIFKNLSQGKLPVLGAMDEVKAIDAVRAAGLDTMTVAAFGSKGMNPASVKSFVVTDDLVDTLSLEDVGEQWVSQGHTPVVFKRALIAKVGHIARTMHGAGINHRDFYLAHFLMPESDVKQQNVDGPMYLIDLHRSQVRSTVPRRWQIKDLGGLYFSTARFGMTRRDLLRFVRAYTGLPLRQALEDFRLWEAVRREAEKIYRRYFEVEPELPLQFNLHPGKDI